MARKKQTPAPALPLQTDDDILVQALDRMNTIKEEASEANARASSLRRGLKERGISARAATLGCAIRVLEEGPQRDEETRALLVVLRAANDNTRKIAIEVLGLGEAPAMEAVDSGAWMDDVLDALDSRQEAREEALPAPSPEGESAEEEETPPADWGEENSVAATDDDLDEAGQFFNAGRASAIAGQMPEDNPFDGRTTAGKLWAEGFSSAVNAVQEQESDEPEAATEVLIEDDDELGDEEPLPVDAPPPPSTVVPLHPVAAG